MTPIEFLTLSGTDRAQHVNGSLLRHLQGTLHLLEMWRCAPHVRMAGLFHSVYGTSIYERASVPFERRKEVSAVIGAEAERLAHLFCVIRRPIALLEAIETFSVANRVNGEQYRITPMTLTELLEIECANLLEQNLGKEFLSSLLERVRLREISLRTPILVAVEAVLR